MAGLQTEQFDTKYLIILLAALGSAFLLESTLPDLPPIVNAFLIPLSVAYITLQIINWLFPQIDTKGRNVMTYISDKTSSAIESTNYVQVLPIFVIVAGLFIFVVSKF
jgi:hypothetical protein